MEKYFTWVSLLVLISMPWVCAQESPDALKEPAGRKAWILATTVPEDVANPLKILSGEKLQEVKIYMRSMSEPVKIDKTGTVRAVKEVTDKDGKIVYENLSHAVVPEGVGEALIILVPNKVGEEGLRFSSKVIDLAKFKEGGCLYINLVKTKLGITIGDLKTVVSPGGMEFINPLEEKEKDVLPMSFFYEVPNNEGAEWKLMTSSKMAIYKSRREICIFYYNEEIQNVDFRGIPFMTPQPRPEPRQP